MRIIWVTRNFLDYRIPVYQSMATLAKDNFFLIFSKDIRANPPRVVQNAKESLKEKAIALDGEICLGIPYNPAKKDSGMRYYHQPGLMKLIKSLNPDVIITDAFNNWTIPVLTMKAFGSIKHVMCYERTLHTERNSKWIKTVLRKLAFKWIDAIHCNGVLSKEYLCHLGYPEKKIFLGNMAADYKGLQRSVNEVVQQEIDQFKKEKHITGPIFLYIGRMIYQKGIFELLNAWKSFSETALEPSLIMIGGGVIEEKVKSYINQHHLERAIMVGNVDYSEVAKYYAIADILIMPTLDDNWSLVVPEAMSLGLPIICSKYNGCWPELVKRENGWVFDPLNPLEFLNTLKNAWSQYPLWKKMGQESKLIVADYTPEKIASQIFLTITGICNHT